MAEWLLYEHDDGRHAVAPSAEAAAFAHGDPAWHRVGPVEVPDGLSRALQIVQSEIARAEALLNVEGGGRPLFDRAQTEAGIAALRTVAEAIERERNAGVKTCPSCGVEMEGAFFHFRHCTTPTLGVKGPDHG